MDKSLIAAAVAIAFGSSAGTHAASDGDYAGQQERITAEYRVAQQKCGDLSGNAKDICTAQAKGNEKVAKAELDARRDNHSAETQHKLRIVKAEAAHEVSRERCDDLAGNAKDVCVKDVRAALIRAKAEVDADRKAGSASGANREKIAAKVENVTREADYEAAAERCDAYAGETRNRCVAETKVRFGVK